MDCKNCGICCTNSPIMIFHDEFEILKEKRSNIEIGPDYKIVKYIKPPCPFLIENQCSIYDDRPLTCRKYPLIDFIQNNIVNIGLHPFCHHFKNPSEMGKVLSKFWLEKSQISEKEYEDMFQALIEQEARVILASQILPEKIRHLFVTFGNEDQFKHGDHDTVYIIQIPEQEFQEMIRDIIWDLKEDNEYMKGIRKYYNKETVKFLKRFQGNT